MFMKKGALAATLLDVYNLIRQFYDNSRLLYTDSLSCLASSPYHGDIFSGRKNCEKGKKWIFLYNKTLVVTLYPDSC